ncbi:hypothetical protein Ciccas_004422 [Cichlidogyrus casuarinus]|uniref:Protein MCM10 homolog n=1 Tax=Cichlidogyrus casuarinus TaxID=1844966 RepID=A0ABD2QCI1_9PLAT
MSDSEDFILDKNGDDEVIYDNKPQYVLQTEILVDLESDNDNVNDSQPTGSNLQRKSSNLRDALGLRQNDIPLYIYKMRSLGYPPGWLKAARKVTDVSFVHPNSDETVSDSSKRDGYSRDALIRFPGFNCSVSRRTHDFAQTLNCPRYSSSDHVDEFYRRLYKSVNDAKPREKRSLETLEQERQELLEKIQKMSDADQFEILDTCISTESKSESIPSQIKVENVSIPTAPDVVEVKVEQIDKPTPEEGMTALPSSEILQLLADKSKDSGDLQPSSSYSSLPDLSAFSRDVLPYKPFENLANSTGSFKKVFNALKKAKQLFTHIIASKFPDKKKRRDAHLTSLSTQQIAELVAQGNVEPVPEEEDDDIDWDDIGQVGADDFLASKPKPSLDAGVDLLFQKTCQTEATTSHDSDPEQDDRSRILSEYGQAVVNKLKESNQKKKEKRVESLVNRDLISKDTQNHPPTLPSPIPEKSLVEKAPKDKNYLVLSPTNRCEDRTVLSLRAFVQKAYTFTGPNATPTENVVLVGVVGGRASARESRAGNKYSTWTMTDLDSIGPGLSRNGSVKMFLFGKVHEQLWKVVEGTVVAILRPKLMSNKDPGVKKDPKEIAICVDNHQFVMVMGDSPDYAICCANNLSSGQQCFRVVNKSASKYCELHLKQAYMAASSNRATFSAPSSSLFGNKKKAKSDCFMIDNSWTALNSTSLNARNCSGIQLERSSSQEKMKPGEFVEKVLMKKCTAGALNLKQTLEGKTKPGLDKTEAGSEVKRTEAGTFKSFFQQRSQENQVVDLGPAKEETKKLENIKTADEFMRWKASAIIRKKGGLDQSDKENKLKLLNARIEENLKKARQKKSPLETVLGPNSDQAKNRKRKPSNTEPPVEKRQKSEVDEKVKRKAELMRQLDEGSKFSDLAAAASQEEENRLFDKLERRDEMEQKLLEMHEQECKVGVCKTCDYRAMHISKQCREEGHDIVYVKGVKRFFACKRCQNRTVSFDRYPKFPCTNCGGESFEKTGAIAERKGPKLASEMLSLRGTEQKFL